MDNTSDVVSERGDDSGIESSAPDPTDNNVYIRIAVSDLKIQVRDVMWKKYSKEN